MDASEIVTATVPGAGARRAPAPGHQHPELPTTVDVAIIGAGCCGIATAIHLDALPGHRSILVLEGRAGSDPRSWCSWDDGSDPLPEARSASWNRWEVRTDRGNSVGEDPEHPYTLVRAADRRTAAERRLAASHSVALIDGAPVVSAVTDAGSLVVATRDASVRAATVLDARGPRCPEDVPEGRVLLHQRFIGQWITTDHAVFDPSTVTLMDFTGQRQEDRVAFVYVLPVSETEALVESTIFTTDPADPTDHRQQIAAYVRRRWRLDSEQWRIDEEEQGCIPMTDIPPAALTPPALSRGIASEEGSIVSVIGTTRPSSGYGFGRTNRHSAVIARHLADHTAVPPFTERHRTRFLDAVFLRFLRDRPEEAPEAFRRLLALPGPMIVRFLTERSTLTDDIRIVLGLQKRPFLQALARTLLDARLRHGHRPRAAS